MNVIKYKYCMFSKEKYTIKQTDRSTKIKIIYRYVMSIELAGGWDKFYFDSFIQIEILFLKVSQGLKSFIHDFFAYGRYLN